MLYTAEVAILKVPKVEQLQERITWSNWIPLNSGLNNRLDKTGFHNAKLRWETGKLQKKR